MNEFKVGLLALATMAAVVYMSLKVTSNQSGFGEYLTYRTIVNDASGIFPKTPIKVAGINAGRIKNIELQGNKALITFEVLEKIKVNEDSILRIKTVGFLGDKYIEVIIGKSDDRLKPSSFITSKEGGGIENLVRDAGEILVDVKEIVKSVKGSVSPNGQEPPVTTILNGIKEVIDNTKSLTADLKDLMSDNKGKVANMIGNLEKFSSDLAYQLDRGKEDSSLADVKRILGNVETMTEDLKVIVGNMRQGKGTIGQLLVDDKIADEVKETLAGVKKIVGKVDAIRTELEVYTGINSDDGSSTEAALRIFPSPERFYLLGIATSEFGVESKRYTTTIENGNESTLITKEKEKDTYRFNIQMGRKLGNFLVRGGLIESTGGFGVDYEIHSWGLRFGSEVFDYREDIGPNLRLYSELQIWNVVHGKISLDDLLEDSRSATVYAGLKFNDEDLKGLIGFFF